MMKQSPRRNRILVTLVLTLFILSAFVLSGFTVATSVGKTITSELPLNQGTNCNVITNVVKNCSFETRDSNNNNGVAVNWEPYSNGQAHTGWYDETWPEAVHTGKHAQLMEIFEVEANVLDRVIAIHQTVDVAPNSTYNLLLNAILRSQVQPADRNKNEVEMHWGIDFSGQGNYDNVETWNRMILQEQFRLGSTGEYPDDKPLFYQPITGTVSTGSSNRITLFIRGLKKFSTGAEVNFDVDDVFLVGATRGPAPLPQTGAVIDPAAPNQQASNLPTSGAILPGNVSGGTFALAGLVLIALGVSAAMSVINRKP